MLLVAALVYCARLDDPPGDRPRAPDAPPVYVHDEAYTAFTAHRLLRGDPNVWNPHATPAHARAFDRADLTAFTGYEWTHPPLAKLIMAAGIAAFGFDPIAYRLGGVLCGLLTLLLAWRLAIRMRGPRFGLVVLTLLASDGLLFVMSRVAMNDIYVTACVAGAIYALYRFLAERRLRWLLLAGAVSGTGFAVKWSMGPVAFACGVTTFIALAFARVDRPARMRALGVWLIAFVALPIAIYLAAYAPFFASGHDLADFAELQATMWRFHDALVVQHSQTSPWYEWPLMTEPVWMFHELPRMSRAAREIYAGGNPLLWWAFLPCLLWVAVRALRRRELGDRLVLLAFAAVWLPWALHGRAGYLHYLVPAVPFGAIAVATALHDLAACLRSRSRWLVATYAAACVAAFVWFYPIWSALPVPAAELAGSRWFWLESWR